VNALINTFVMPLSVVAKYNAKSQSDCGSKYIENECMLELCLVHLKEQAP